MFREKYNSLTQKRGYLYIRESIYVRDKRTIKRIPHKLCDGKATKERGKYSIKKDTYCGKITEIEILHIITFQDYLEQRNIEYIKFKINSSFDIILDTFINYLLYIYGLDKEDFFNGKKRVYAINNGFLSKDTILWFRRFSIRNNYPITKEMERFTFRAEDIGIFDEDIISLMFSKIMPTDNIITEDIEDKQTQSNKLQVKNLREFIKQQSN